MIDIPKNKSKFRPGDKVDVKCVEVECGPYFKAIVTGVRYRNGEFEYAVFDLKNEMECDGYSEDWLS